MPIYDGRKVGTNFADILSNLKGLPRYGGELSYGSCAVVAYTVNSFKKKQDDMLSMSFNIHWSMLLGQTGIKG